MITTTHKSPTHYEPLYNDQNCVPIGACILLAGWKTGKWWQNVFQY